MHFSCLGLGPLKVGLFTSILFIFSPPPTELEAAYNKPFMGDAATVFVDCLQRKEDDIQYNHIEVHAKAICVIQSSGTGKSRMLTEVSLCPTARHHMTMFLLGWQTNIHTSHLSSPSKFSRLPPV